MSVCSQGNNLQTILQPLYKLTELQHSLESENPISKLVNFLDSLSNAALSDPYNEHKEVSAVEALSEIHRYICSLSLDQEVVDKLAMELPKAVSKFAGISSSSLDMAISIIDQFIAKCGPKYMLFILCYVKQVRRPALPLTLSLLYQGSQRISVLVDLIRREMHAAICSCMPVVKNVQQIKNKAHPYISFWVPSVFELVELVLKPPQGGSPSLPEQRDAVLSVLNLYRFVLMTESAGKTNYTKILSRSNLLKVYNEWLLPLQTRVTGIMTDNKSSVCDLNPLEMVLSRCIELVEEKLNQVT